MEAALSALWQNNHIQFARLLSEIAGLSLTADQMAELADQMDLEIPDINRLFDRAMLEWERAKDGKPVRQETPPDEIEAFLGKRPVESADSDLEIPSSWCLVDQELGTRCLLSLVQTIEVTGGLDGLNNHPVADPDWEDMGDCYRMACAALGKRPVIQDPNFDSNAPRVVSISEELPAIVNADVALQAVRSLVDSINATGGIAYDRKGSPIPVGDPEWVDLAIAYLHGCRSLGVTPLLGVADDDSRW